MLPLYNYHILFKVCKPLRGKYQLSVACFLVLNGAYLYSVILGKPFTSYALLKFVTYYNNVKIGSYIRVLIERNFITLAGATKRSENLYTISETGIQVIKELNESYQEQLIIFCNKYNIEL